LWQAKEQAASEATVLTAKHNALEGQPTAQSEQSTGPAGQGAVATTAGGKTVTPSHEESKALLEKTKLRAADRKTMATLDQRIDNEKQLANAYGQWIGIVVMEQRALTNGALRGVLVILALAILGLFVDDWIGSLLARMSMDRRQTETLRTATRVTLQVVGVLLVLLVIFGPPTQLGTFLGLAGAGLTVALKDFIIGFFGWFVLMGKNGIRLGDWVEINGVTGEVVELGVFHTVLLETGNWNDSGHPTGRRVTFTNSFAVEGHYFNFSTSGQWLWDELQIVLPSGQNPYPIVDAIHKKILEATSENARQAEEEWKGAAKSRDMTALSAAPSINVKPVIGGTEISVRYITRANERSELRAKLNHDAVDLLGSGFAPQPDADSPKPALKSN
jgi:small-conductance mechanosensitive channel